MKVAELRQFLVSLAGPVEASGGKSVAADLRRAADGLGPFDGETVAGFADFLALAKQYKETGVFAAAAKPKARAAKAPALSPDDAAAAYEALYERGVTESLPDAAIDAELARLDKALSKDDLVALAKRVGVHKALKTKKDAVAELRRRVVDRRDTRDRVRLGDEGAGGGQYVGENVPPGPS